ncbi:MAG: VCBS repeat-containing protein, partial [Verrucomicrobia bacterium]|nr:VCBS repeat-containing protein [Verrucomicrobiota bacterium]
MAGDVNGDGTLDLVVANGADTKLTVLTNSGAGLFGLASSPGGANNVPSVGVADFNGDGRLDVVAANYYSGSVTVLTNNGAGLYAVAATLPTGAYPLNVSTGDVNGDGKPDFVVADSGASTVMVYTNNGQGGFASSGAFACGSATWAALIVTNLYGGGRVDIVTADSSDGTLTVLTNGGGGRFAAACKYPVGSTPESVAAVDVNGDGWVDLISANGGGNTLTVLTNNGSGTCVVSGTYAAGSSPMNVQAADVNGDGWVDLACADYNGNTVITFLNNGSGGFTAVATNSVGANPSGLAFADMNGDGKVDLICADRGANSVMVLTNTLVFPALPPYITGQPASRTNAVGTTAVFTVIAGGTGPLSYQWSFNATNISGATNATLTLSNIQPGNAGGYTVQVSNANGSTNSLAAVLTVVQPPVVITQPQSQSVLTYYGASFTVTVSGNVPLSFQWRKNGTNLLDGGNISGSSTTNLNITSVSLADAGNYDVVVSNPYGTTNSLAAVLTVPETVVMLGSSSVMSGNTITVPVLMNALGVENSFEGSVAYDSSKLVLQSVQTGQATSGAYLLPIYTNGYVGFAILLNIGQTLSVGTQEVAQLVFQALPVTNSTSTSLAFSDYPDGRQLLDNNLNSLPAVYQNGTLNLAPAEYAADVFPRTNGDSTVNLQDWGEVGRMVAGLDVPTNSDEFLRADCAPRNAPDGALTVADWVQAGRYAVHLDPLTVVTPPLSSGVILARPNGSPVSSRSLLVGNVTASRGQTVTVPVQMICTTNENAAGITVDYNTNVLKLAGVSLGAAAGGGRLNVNSNNLGRVGLTVALLPGFSFPTGTNEVANLKFTTSSSASGSTPLTLDGSVVRLQVV